MRNLCYILFVVLICGSSLAQETAMSAAEIRAFKAKVEASATSTKTIQSDFVQLKHLDFLSNDIETSGSMSFKSPNKVRWEYTKPYQYQVIFKDDVLLINDGGTKSKVDIGSSKMFKKLNELIVNSVKGNLFMDEDFSIQYVQTPQAYKVTFIPKDQKIAAYIAQFELLFDKDDGQVLEVKMLEPSQDYTRIIFKNRKLNSAIDDAVFN